MKACRRMVSSHPFAFVPFSYWSQARYALSIVSWTRSSASAAFPVSRRATRYRESRCTSASRSKVARFSSTGPGAGRSEEHTSELQSRLHLVCRLLLEKKKNIKIERKKADDRV